VYKRQVQAFLPDLESVSVLTGIIGRKISNSGKLVVNAGDEIKHLVEDAYYRETKLVNSEGIINIRIEKLKESFNGDILLYDNNIRMYNPEQDFNSLLLSLRDKVKNENSVYSFNAEYKTERIFDSLFKTGKNNLVIENENGIYDKIPLLIDREIFVKGPAGKTGIMIKGNSAYITVSCCRNGICKHSGEISGLGNMIACAPNKVMIYIEKA